MQDRQAWGGSGAPGPGPAPPTKDGQVDEREAWIEQNAARLRETLAAQQVRVELAALLGGDDSAQQRQRRQEAARRELASIELRWKLLEDEVWEA
jgi:hypothetical protein